MTPSTADLEERLRDRFAADALVAPPSPSGLAAAARGEAAVTLSRRSRRVAGLLVAVVVVLAAGSATWMLARGDGPTEVTVADGRVPDRPGAVVPLPSSGWKPGDDALAGAFSGVVTVDADGCVSAGLLWPEGYAARRDADGRVSILNAAGKVVLRDGDRFEVGGGPGPSGGTCGPPGTETFAMMSFPKRVG
jgi:hypothetical protein